MKTLVHKKIKLMTAFIVLILTLSVFATALIAPNINGSQSKTSIVNPSASIGTITLTPSTGAFPGQLVQFVWSGVPNNLIPPVYVTVYFNDTAYTTIIANYTGNTLYGSFVMPNGNAGSYYNLYFTYSDSAQIYSYISVPATSTGYINSGPYYIMNSTNIQTTSPVSVTTTTSPGTTSYNISASKTIGWLNTTTNYTPSLSSEFTKINGGTPSQSTYLNGSISFTTPTSYSSTTSQTLTVNSTIYNNGTANLNLAGKTTITTIFNVTNSSYVPTINYMSSSFTLIQVVNGTTVEFSFTGSYNKPITSPGPYVLSGTFITNMPSTLTLSGKFNSTYNILDLSISPNGYFNMNYTLTLSFQGVSSDGIVSVGATYLNSTSLWVHEPIIKTENITSLHEVSLSTPHYFTSQYRGLKNVGYSGTITTIFTVSSTSIPLTFTLSGWWPNLVNGASNFNNVNSISISGLNVTLPGSAKIWINTTSYIQGVADIAPIYWNFSLVLNYQASKYVIVVDGSYSNSTATMKVPVSSLLLTSYSTDVPTSGSSNFNTYLGYFNLASVTILSSTTTITDPYNSQSIPVTFEKYDFSSLSYLLNTPTTITLYGDRVVSGFNETINNGAFSNYNSLKYYIKVDSIVPTVFGTTISGSFIANYTGNVSANNTYHTIYAYQNFSLTPTSFAIPNNGTVSEFTTTISYVNVSLNNILPKVTSMNETGAMYAWFHNYIGSLYIDGKTSTSTGQIVTTTPSSLVLSGTVISYSGFTTPIKIWFNATVSQKLIYPGLYGSPLFTGKFEYNSTIIFLSNTTTPRVYGWQVLSNQTIIFSTTIPSSYHDNNFASGSQVTNYMTVKSIGLELTNAISAGPFTLINNAQNSWIKVSFTSSATISSSGSGTITSSGTLTYTSSPFSTYSAPSSLNVFLTYTVTLPLEGINLAGYYNFSISTGVINIELNSPNGTSSFNNIWLSTPITNGFVASGTNSYSFTGSVNYNLVYTIMAFGVNFAFTVNANNEAIQIVTSQVTISNIGSYYFYGNAISGDSSGNVVGYINVIKFSQTNGSIEFSGMFNVVGFYGNGSKYSLQITVPDQKDNLPAYYANIPVTNSVTFNYATITTNKGSINYGTYNLLYGGYILVAINDGIATILNNQKYIFENLTELKASIAYVNGTTIWLKTNLGYMNTTLQALVPVINEINGNVVTINTVVGKINYNLTQFKDWILVNITNGIAQLQASLNGINVSLHASLNALNGNIAYVNGTTIWLKTNLGYMNTTLQALVPVINEIN
ncbi:MAG: hypothetical protein QW726_05425, partial [Fervidicoccaceae archaeon]